MAKYDDEQIGYKIASLMVFYKGSISYDRLRKLPIPELTRLCEYAAKINLEKEKAAKNAI